MTLETMYKYLNRMDAIEGYISKPHTCKPGCYCVLIKVRIAQIRAMAAHKETRESAEKE